MFGISKLHLKAALILFLVLLVWVGYQQDYFKHQLTTTGVEHDPNCDLRAGPCEMMLDDGVSVSLGIEPRSIPVAKELTLDVKVSGLSVNAIMVDINGVDMKMPPNRVRLKKLPNEHFSGLAGLMYCTRNAMEWEMVLELTTDQGQINVPYRFITVSNITFE